MLTYHVVLYWKLSVAFKHTHPSLVPPSLLHKVSSPTCGGPLPVPSNDNFNLSSVCTLHNLIALLAVCNLGVLVLLVTAKRYTYISIIIAVSILELPNASYPPPLCRCHCCLYNLATGLYARYFVNQALTAGITVPIVAAATSMDYNHHSNCYQCQCYYCSGTNVLPVTAGK